MTEGKRKLNAVLRRIYCAKIIFFWFHRGEKYHIPDRRAVGEEHDETVDAHAETARGGQTVL